MLVVTLADLILSGMAGTCKNNACLDKVDIDFIKSTKAQTNLATMFDSFEKEVIL
jgi:hypothetical protein